jgi:hypothetical protein
MIRLCLIVTFVSFISSPILSQVDSNKVFEKSKGTWMAPIHSGRQLGPNTQGIQGSRAIFISGKSDSVFAVFSGLAVSIKEIDSAYIIITKYKDYFIAYYGLKKPIINIGDFITTGQQIGNLAQDSEGIFSLDIYLTSKSGELDPHLWFKE